MNQSLNQDAIEISVIIPTYNRARRIGAAISSVLEQNNKSQQYVLNEILIIDDGSTDDTDLVVKNIKDQRVRYHKCIENKGAASARNLGVALSTSRWIAFQDSDDLWFPGKLEAQVQCLLEENRPDMVYTGFEAVFSDKVLQIVSQNDATIMNLNEKNFIGTPTILVSKEAFLDIGGFDEKMKALEDWDFVLRFSDKYIIKGMPEVCVKADYTTEGISTDIGKYYENRCYLIAKNMELFQRHNCFETAVKSLLEHANNAGVLQYVGKMLELSLCAEV